MDIRSLHHLLKIAAHTDTTGYQLLTAAGMITKVVLCRIEGAGTGVAWAVIRNGEPDFVAVYTADEAEAYRTYADEIDLARTEHATLSV